MKEVILTVETPGTTSAWLTTPISNIGPRNKVAESCRLPTSQKANSWPYGHSVPVAGVG